MIDEWPEYKQKKIKNLYGIQLVYVSFVLFSFALKDCILVTTFWCFYKLPYSLKFSYSFSVYLINNAGPLSTSHRLPKTCWVFEVRFSSMLPNRSPGIAGFVPARRWLDRTCGLKLYNNPATTTKIQDIYLVTLYSRSVHPNLVSLHIWNQMK